MLINGFTVIEDRTLGVSDSERGLFLTTISMYKVHANILKFSFQDGHQMYRVDARVISLCVTWKVSIRL
jgi:hypothetical protein